MHMILRLYQVVSSCVDRPSPPLDSFLWAFWFPVFLILEGCVLYPTARGYPRVGGGGSDKGLI